MIDDIIVCKEYKVNGVVVGGLNEKDLKIDEDFLKEVMVEAGNMKVTFHKASDQTPNLKETLEILGNYKVDTVLTQGGSKPILENI